LSRQKQFPIDAKAMFQVVLGARLEIEIIARSAWNAGYMLVAEKFRRGRVLLGGDAAHLFTPTGELGYNTAVEDAVDLGGSSPRWSRVGAAGLIETMRPAPGHCQAQHRLCARVCHSVGRFVPPRKNSRTTTLQEAARKRGRSSRCPRALQFNIPGITFGGRYDGSPIIVADGGAAGGHQQRVRAECVSRRARAALWLADGRSLYDALGFEFTLLRLGSRPPMQLLLWPLPPYLRSRSRSSMSQAKRRAISMKPILR
jgi:hypothetical protein